MPWSWKWSSGGLQQCEAPAGGYEVWTLHPSGCGSIWLKAVNHQDLGKMFSDRGIHYLIGFKDVFAVCALKGVGQLHSITPLPARGQMLSATCSLCLQNGNGAGNDLICDYVTSFTLKGQAFKMIRRPLCLLLDGIIVLIATCIPMDFL